MTDVSVPGGNADAEGLDRRSLIKKGAVAGAVVWAAPVLYDSVLSPAGALSDIGGSGDPCVPVAVAHSWSARYPSPTTVSYPLVFDNGLTVGLADPTSAYSSSASGVTTTFVRTSQPRTLQWQMGSTGAGPITITLTFATPVSNLAFSLLDIDLSGSAWKDRAIVSATGPGGPLTIGAVGGSNVQVTGAPGPSVTAVGLANTPNSGTGSTASDVAYTIVGPVSTVTISYQRASGTSSQGIGIADLAWLTTCP